MPFSRSLAGVVAALLLSGCCRLPVLHPEAIAPPAQSCTLLTVHARGVQIYTRETSADGKATWKLAGPDADLFDANGKKIGHHFRTPDGPAWMFDAGGGIIGSLPPKAHADVDPHAIPWLLLEIKRNTTPAPGKLARATHVQRVETTGGIPPADDAATLAAGEYRSPYEADYWFVGPRD